MKTSRKNKMIKTTGKFNTINKLRSSYFISPILTIFLFAILHLNESAIFPDLFNLAGKNSIVGYLQTIISSIASLTGFLIAIFIVAFEFYWKNLRQIYLQYFLRNKALQILINFYVFVFLFAGCSLLVLKSDAPQSVGELTVCYISILSFLLLIPATFYLAYKLMKSLNLKDIINEYLIRLSFDEIHLINSNKQIVAGVPRINNRSYNYDDSPSDCLMIIQMLITKTFEYDYINAQLYLNEVTDQFIKYILEKAEPELEHKTIKHQYTFGAFILSFIDESKMNSKINEDLVFRKVVLVIEEFYFRYNKTRLNLSYIEPFREATYSELINMSDGNKRQIKKIFTSLKKVIENVIKTNLPEERHVMIFDAAYRKEHGIPAQDRYPDEYYQSKYSWRKFIDKYPEYFVKELEQSITNRSEKQFFETLPIFKRCIFSLFWDAKEDHKELKSIWVNENFCHLLTKYRIAVDRGIVHQIDSNDILWNGDIVELYDKNDWCAKMVLGYYLDFMSWLNQKGKLTYKVFCGVYSLEGYGDLISGCSLSMLGSFFARHYHIDERYEEGLESVLNKIDDIFQDYKRGITSDEIHYKTMIKVLEKIQKEYLTNTKKENESEFLLKRIRQSLFRIQRRIRISE